MDASEDGPFEPAPFEPAPNPVDRDQTLLKELVWFVGSVALIGGVVAYLVLVVQFASSRRLTL